LEVPKSFQRYKIVLSVKTLAGPVYFVFIYIIISIWQGVLCIPDGQFGETSKLAQSVTLGTIITFDDEMAPIK